jgi:hypothetical protein
MDTAIERKMTARAVELGNSGDPGALPELIALTHSTSSNTRRLASSAIGKLAGVADAHAAVTALQPVLRDVHPQVRQYAVKALKAYGRHAEASLHDLADIARNPGEKEYNRRDAALAIEVIEESIRIAELQAEHLCQRCGVRISADEYARSMKAFQRLFCDRCFDEVYLERRNFDTKVELNKRIQARDGTLVQSDGERRIANWLSGQDITYRYDERIRIVEGYAIRPDFYLPEFDIYIEYWGMDTIDYKIGMFKKQKLYQQQGKRLISLYFKDKPRLETLLQKKLTWYVAGNGVTE